MKQRINRNTISALVAGVAVLLLGLAPVSAEPSSLQAQESAPSTTNQPIQRTFSEPIPLTAEDLAYEPPRPQPKLPPGAIALEIKVTAIVPPMRHIVIDATGAITQVTSNTLEDIEPKVYESDVKSDNERLLTDEIYQQYRSAVPIGTAARGVLYERGIPIAAVNSFRQN